VIEAERGLAAPRRPRKRSQLGALIYLQLRTALRKWELVARDPLRRLAWVPYLLSVVWVVGARLFRLQIQLPRSTGEYVGALLPPLLFLLIAMSRAGGGRLYQSRAHAHLVGALGLPVWLLVAFQHLQRMPFQLFNFGLFGVLLLPEALGLGPVHVIEAVIALLLGLLFLGGAGLVSFAIRLRSPRLGQVWTVTALVIAGLLALPVLPLLTGHSIPMLNNADKIAVWSPGGLLVMGASGSLLADVILLALAAGVLGLGVALTRELGPELAEASYRYFMLVDSARASGNAGMTGANVRLRDPVQASTSTNLRGAGVLAWKTWVEFRRSGTGWWRLLAVGSQLLFGVVLGSVWSSIMGSHQSSSVTTLVIAGVVTILVSTGFSSGRQFGPLLRNPLFALNRDSLAERLLAFLFTRQVTESIGSLFALVGLALVLPAYITVILAVALVGRAVAIVILGLDLYVFAWLPSATDRVMATRMIRLAIMAVVVPGGTVFAFWAFRTPAPPLALLIPIPLLVLLGWRLIVMAGARLEGNGLAVAIAEKR
jgi:hypothetical protein